MQITADFNDSFWEPPETEFQPLLDFESEISDQVPHNDIALLTQRIKRSFLDYVRQGVMLDTVRRYRLYKRQYQDFADYCNNAKRAIALLLPENHLFGQDLLGTNQVQVENSSYFGSASA
ncbi:hypothetical protein QT986_34055, partial [Microcoleus sp. herbarium14]